MVDGKQRLQTIVDFTDDKVAIPTDFIDVNLRNRRWSDLEIDTRKRFWNYSLIVEMIPDVNDAPIRNIFERINRNSRKLTPQEMRHAKYEGWFIGFVEAEAEKVEWKSLGVVTSARIKRMLDVQFISELCALILKGEILGFDQNHLDNIYADYDDIEELATFIEDEFANVVETIKGKISTIVEIVRDLERYLKVQSHFYTLWAYLYFERDRLPELEAFATQYKDFLDAVSEALGSPETLTSETSEPSNPDKDDVRRAVLEYANSVRGASTDLTPRRRRHGALLSVING